MGDFIGNYILNQINIRQSVGMPKIQIIFNFKIYEKQNKP